MSHIWEGIKINTDFLDHFGGLLMRDFDSTEKYYEKKAPVLVIAGRYDFWAPYFLWNGVKDIIPNFTFILFENSGHNPVLEVHDEFERKLLEWLEKTR